MLRRSLVLTLLVLGALAAPASAAITVSTATAVEGQPLVFTVTRDNQIVETPTAATADGTATAPADYTARTGGNVFGLTGTTAQVSIPTVDDEAAEGDETVRLIVTPNGGGQPIEAIGTITDNEPALAVGDARAAEGAGAIDIPVSRTAVGKATRVAYSIAAGSAQPGADFQAASGEITIPAGATGGSIRVPVVDDATDEDDETVAVTITAVDPATIARGAAVGTILNDDLRAITLTDTPTVEGDGENTVVRVPVGLNAPTFRTVTVQFGTIDSSARAGRDFLTTVGTVTIPAGQTQGFAQVPIVSDDTIEKAEQFAIIAGRESGARIADGVAVVAIADDDAAAGDETPPKLGLTKPKRSGRALSLRVTCPRAEQRCRGRVTFFTQADRRAKVKSLRRERRLGRASFTITGGRSRTVRVTLARSVAAAARRAGRLRIRAFVVAEDAAENTVTRTASATIRFRR